MAQINRANFAANLNTGPAWTGGVAPTSAYIAAWGTPNITTGPTQALGGAVSWQGILLQSAQTTNISIGTTGAAMTIGASGIDLSASGANLTIASPVVIVLGASQTWTVASGRTLTSSLAANAISGNAQNLILNGLGTKTLPGPATNWTNSTVTVAAGLAIASAINSLGAASNSVVVSSGGALRMTASPAQTAFTVSGQGNALQAGAIFFSAAGGIASGKTVTLTGASPTIGVSASTQAGVIAGPSITGNVTFNMSGTNTTTATFTNASSFLVASGNYVVLQGVDPLTGTATAADFGLSTTDLNGLGNASNAVNVKSSLRLLNGDNSAVTLSRNYLFDGESTNATPTTYAIAPKAATGSGLTFQGTVSIGTTGYWIKTNTSGGTSPTYIQFGNATGGKIDGQVNIRVFSSITTLKLHPNLDISTWIPSGGVGGEIYVNDVSYGVAPTGAATWNPNNTVDNIAGSDLTLAHSTLSIFAGTVTFTGTDNLSTGLTPITTTGGVTFAVAAKKLTIPGNILGSGTLSKSGVGTLSLSGNNTGFSRVSHTGGVLELNSAGSAGPSAADFVFAATSTTIDSTTGATLSQTGGINLGASAGSFTWKGSADLSMGSGNVTHGGSRTVTFVNGATGILTFAGPLNSTTLTYLWNVGGSVAGAKNVLYIANTNASLATTGQVTAGYLRAGNATSLGSESVVGSVTWTVSSGAAIELINGITTSSKKNFLGLGAGAGPNTDGALRSVSGTNKWQGGISFVSATGARIQVDADTFTLDPAGSTAYTGIDGPVTPNTAPITFSAGSGATLNQDRILAAGFSTVAIANGSGTVVLSKANLHSGAMTCSAGTTKLTNVAAVGAGAGNSATVTAGATMESTVKAVFPATLTLGSSPTTAATFRVSV
jgi:autotransporter-associated beta strand protein